MDSKENNVIYQKNPRVTAGILSALTFSWTCGLFRKGYRKDLEINDLYEPLPEHSAQLLGDTFEYYWTKELEAYKANPRRKPSLIRVIFKAYGGSLLLYSTCAFISTFVFKIGQPLLLNQLIQHFSPNSTVTYNEATFYAAGVVSCVGLNVLTLSPCIHWGSHLGMKVRVATSSLIYRKSLRLSKEATSRIGAGHIVNLLSNDASRFNYALCYLPEAVTSPMITIVMTYIMWVEVGLPSLIGVALLILFAPLQGVLAKKTATLRTRIAFRTDYRIRLMSEIIAGIQVIKMYAWEKSFAKLVAFARRKELAIVREKAYTVGVLGTATSFSTKLAIFASLLAYAYQGYAIKTNVVFVMVLCYNIIEETLILIFPEAVTSGAEAFVSIRRMEAFLMSEEAAESIAQPSATTAENGYIIMKHLCAKWALSEQEGNTLDHINVRMRSGSLVAIIGAVGSGKSSFLQLILREIPVTSGVIEVGGTVSYAPQEPWLFGGTVRQNILFGLPMDEEKYEKVVRVCALVADFEQLPNGDKTVIGDRGVSLSGGQKARVNLARAVYRDSDIYLLDDPLSAVDSHVGGHLFKECICGYLAGKTVVLVTHHVQRLTNVGHVIHLESGKISAQGSFQELSEMGMNLASLDESESPEEEESEMLSQKKSEDLPSTGIQKDTEIRSFGKVTASVYLTYLKAVKSIALVLCVVATFIVIILATSGSDYWLSFWVNQEEYVFPYEDHITVPLLGELNRTFCMTVYAILIGILITVAIIRTILLCLMCVRASINLHDSLFKSIAQATMNFFNNTPSGQILNRFSRDTGVIDEELPELLCACLRTAFQVMGSFIIILIVNWYLMLPFAVVMFVLYFLRRYAMATFTSIKRLESVTRSPIYTHVNASLQGLSTIRAMQAQTRLHQEFDRKLDNHSAAWYYVIGTNRAFAYYLDLTCWFYTSVVTFSFLVLDNNFLGGDVGLAITQSIGLTLVFQWCIRMSAELEISMTSVERVSEFGKIESEDKHSVSPGDKKLCGWPYKGSIQFSNVFLFYDTTKTAVLKNINFDIRPGEKIGVVGRTGAGKSSLVAALFRLQKITGKIIIDGIDTSTIGLQELRSSISIIPQDPVVFSGTMRFNLDPFEEYQDSDLWNVLEECELKSVVQNCTGGLQTNVSEGGVNLSVGQRQLVCLARAILRNSTVLILDEATANVDAKTDDFIQAAIRKRFSHCTVITIAHRLQTIMDSDRIIVMDNGRVVEFGPPQDLLLDPKGHFTHLVDMAGTLSSAIKNQHRESGKDSNDV